MSEQVDCVVIGAGVVGLSIGRAIAQLGREVVVLESEDRIGTGISARNSEIIHAGIYYPQHSLKARLCVAGREMLYGFCEARGIAHKKTGKLIVATTDEQEVRLQTLHQQAINNGVHDVRILNKAEALAMEPALRVHRALFSPSTGIIDSHGLMTALLGEIEQNGGMVALQSPLINAQATEKGFSLHIGGAEPMDLACRTLINAGGLNATAIAHNISGLDARTIPSSYLAKGNYFTLSDPVPFARPIYPLPEPGGLGIHLTRDLGGSARFGPDVEWIETPDYTVSPDRAPAFETAIRQYWPDLPAGALRPDYAGIRPKLHTQGMPAADFVVQDSTEHGIGGLINLYGIESPGLTACLALGQDVARRISDGR